MEGLRIANGVASYQIALAQQTDVRLLKCFVMSLILHIALLPLGAIFFGERQFVSREQVIRVEIEQVETKHEPQKPKQVKPKPQRAVVQKLQRVVRTPQVAARQTVQRRHHVERHKSAAVEAHHAPMRQPPTVHEALKETVKHEERPVEHKPQQVAVRPKVEQKLQEQPSVGFVRQPTTVVELPETTMPQRRRESVITKLTPAFGRKEETMRQEIIASQAELPSSERTTSPVIEVARSLMRERAPSEAAVLSPSLLPNVAGVGVERRPGVASPAPQEDEVVRLPEAPSGRRGAMAKGIPEAMRAPTAVGVLPPGRGGATHVGQFDVGGGSGAHGPQRVLIGRPSESGIGLSQPRPEAYGSGMAMEGGGRIGSALIDQLRGALRPTDEVSGVGEGAGGRGGDKLRPGRVADVGELLHGRGKPTVGGFGGVGGGGAAIGEGAGTGTGAGAGVGAFGLPRSPQRGAGIGIGGEGIGAPQVVGPPASGGGIGTGGSGRGYGGGAGYVSGVGPIAGGGGAGSVGRGGGGGMKARPGAPAIGFGEDVSGYRKGVKAGGGSGLGEPPRGESPGGILRRPSGGVTSPGGVGERPGVGGTTKTGVAGTVSGGVSTSGVPIRREDVGRPIKFVTVPESTEGGLFTDISGEFMRHPLIAIVDKSNWDVHINRVHNVLRELNRRTKIRTLEGERKVALTLNAIKDVPVLFFYGEDSFELTEEEKEALREYVRLGGTIFGDNSHGPFDVSFMREMCKAFNKRMSDWEELPISHPIFNAFYKISAVPPGDLGETYPILALRIDGRHAVIYSRNDYSDVICDHHPGKIAPPIPQQVKELAMRFNINIVIYALKYWQEKRSGQN
ncbi:MAG: DUF4159 domain-containing protein [Armatimonadota bacterium]|nr:DUF4159 domain-containing protein [Armatimonadota bacterium]MCX7776494.1 DUF4159 domain-containing protein [Armatimonadota bacterium]MDW8024291.1 DUF4159 domain-containing protein [Armatimonadota bacterium]